MAERERLTNKERRAASRDERKRKEAEAAQKAKKAQLRNGAITVVVVALVGLLAFQAFRPDPRNLDEAILVSAEAAEEAQAAAGCEVIVEREPLPDRFHFEAAAAPEADAIYTDVRPTHSGPHNVQVTPVAPDGYSRPIDERSSTHNLEHGAIIVWHAEDGDVDGGQIDDWAATLNANGFGNRSELSGAAVLSAPYGGEITSGKPVAFRAWGTAMDCDTFDEDVANAFVARNFGTRGIGPERTFAPYPEEALDFSDAEVDDTTEEEAPIEGDEPDTASKDELEDEVGEESVEDATDELESEDDTDS
ncbi:MAG: DUF3105 domain-containing protein [Nitriliruptor sp.]|uniref:DUF3105 domain-containing protein n=1 Tax=Nitriliruptor sp. TaxID=2448056 RepID=UPI0034A09CB6